MDYETGTDQDLYQFINTGVEKNPYWWYKMIVKSELVIHEKKVFKNGCVLEMKLWEVKKDKKYPDGIKYGLIFINPKTKARVLMDNHTPKGHHYHLDEDEFDYEYAGIEKLVTDFYSLVRDHLGVSL